jgi:hypothetical protein
MGYYAMRAAAREEVTRVDVYEIDDRVIELFCMHCYGRDKINIIHGDAANTLKGKEYDFLYVDCFRDPINSEQLNFTKKILKQNKIGGWHHWLGEQLLSADPTIARLPLEQTLFDYLNNEPTQNRIKHQFPRSVLRQYQAMRELRESNWFNWLG